MQDWMNYVEIFLDVLLDKAQYRLPIVFRYVLGLVLFLMLHLTKLQNLLLFQLTM